MQSQDRYSETRSLQLQLKSVTEKFDVALKNDVQLGLLKPLYHEMRELQIRLDALNNQNSNASKA